MTATDLREIGRLGQQRTPRLRSRSRRLATTRRVGGLPAATRQRRLPRPLLALIVLLAAALAYLGFSASQQGDAESWLLATVPAVPPPDEASVAGPRHAAVGDRASRDGARAEPGRLPFAEIDELRLQLPGASAGAVVFGEATLPEALPLTPIGALEENGSPTRFAGGRDAPAPAYRVLPARSGTRPPTSAAAVMMDRGATVAAPVTGTVVRVQEYALRGSVRDWRVVLQPDSRPDLHVTMVHLHRPAVEAGDHVAAGVTPLGVVREAPFDDGASVPHLRVEVRAAGPEKPLDPNAPAEEQ